ncbi:MAG: hypothetical protein ACQEXN_05620 [Actinomycetota bacterium]
MGAERANTVVAHSGAYSPTIGLPTDKVVVLVLAKELTKAAQLGRLLSRRAEHAIGLVLLLGDSEQGLGDLLGRLQARRSLVVSEDTFPGRDWLRKAHMAMQGSGVDAVRANTGRAGSGLPWRDTFASPRLLLEALETNSYGDALAIQSDDFVLADTSWEASQDLHYAHSLGQIHHVRSSEIDAGNGDPWYTRNICVVMPCIDTARAERTAELLRKRAGVEADIVVAIDDIRQGFIRTLNAVANRSRAKYIVYVAEDAVPGHEWLSKAYSRVERGSFKLLGFNCGKWHGRIASFGMVNRAWAYSMYGDKILYEGYTSHRADNEITAIARTKNQFIYAPECLLVEYDAAKDFLSSERAAGNSHWSDRVLFRERFATGFDHLVDANELASIGHEYLSVKQLKEDAPPLDFS